MAFPRVVPQFATVAAEKRLKERCPVPDDGGKALDLFRKLAAEHEARDGRYMMWLADALKDALLAEYVEQEIAIAHARTMGYAAELPKLEATLQRTEQEWHMLAALHGYFAHSFMMQGAEGIGAFLADMRQQSAKAAKPAAKKESK